MNIDFSNKVYLVTGGASGIGAAVVHYLAQHHGRAVIADINDEAGAALVAQYPWQLRYLRTDVTEFAQLEAACALAEKTFGGLDGAVNSAGIGSLGTVADMPVAEWHKVIDIDLHGVFHACRAAIPLLRKRGGGSIVNISSVAGIRGIPGMVAYCASKAGVIGATRSAAMECAQLRNNIRVNAVLPGAIETPIWAKLGNDGSLPTSRSAYESAMASQRDGARSATPIGVPGSALDIASMVAFLVSSEARFITGSEFIVDGGASASA